MFNSNSRSISDIQEIIRLKTIIDPTIAYVENKSTYRDGGTIRFKFNGNTYYIDRRIGSKTQGKVYNLYPSDKSAKIVDIKYELV